MSAPRQSRRSNRNILAEISRNNKSAADRGRTRVRACSGNRDPTERIGQLPGGSGLVSMPQITVDTTGHRYLVYSGKVAGHNHVYVLDSARPGHWSPPRLVDAAQSSAMISWSVASGHGQLDVGRQESRTLLAVVSDLG